MTQPTQDAAFLAQSQRRVKAASCVVLALLAIAGARLALRNGDLEPETPGTEKTAMEAEGVRSIIVRKDGKKLWEFSAKSSGISSDHAYAWANGVEKGILYKNEAPFWRLTAQNVKLDQRTKDVEAKGKVGAQGPNGLKVSTRRALWSELGERLHCPEPVEATMRGVKVSSASATYDLKRDELRCVSEVKVTSDAATVISPRAVAHVKKGIVSFGGGVVIRIRKRALLER